MKTFASRFAILGCAALLSACATPPPAPPKQEAQAHAAAVPDDVLGRYASALKLMQNQRYDQAAPLLETLAKEHGDLPGPFLNLGIAYVHLNRTDEAEQALRHAAELAPDPVAYNLLGVLYRRAGRFDEARHAYEHALALQPDYADAHLNLGILLELYLQQPQAALEHYARYHELEGDGDKRVELWITDLKRRLSAPEHSTAKVDS